MKAREDSDAPKLTLGGVLNFAGDLSCESQHMSTLPATVGNCHAGQLAFLSNCSAQVTLSNAEQPAVSTFLSLVANIAALPCHHAMLALPADGIRSCCGSERIFVFTSNHPEQLDPALIRPGRMDLHIGLGYCTGEPLC